MLPVFPILLLLYLASIFTAYARAMRYSWGYTICMGLFMGAALATMTTVYADSPQVGRWLETFTTLSAIGLASVYIEWTTEQR